MENNKRVRAIIWGAGGKGKDFLREKIRNYKFEVVCFVDRNPNLWGKLMNGKYPIKSPDQITSIEYEVIVICSQFYEEIRRQLVNDMMIPQNRIITYKDIEEGICKDVIEKYDSSVDDDIKEELNVFRSGKLNYFGRYNPPLDLFHDVIRDMDGYPYVIFEDKKMYFPKDYKFMVLDGKEVVPDLLYEQGKNSPHRYVPDDNCIPEGAVILDAGVCEGNFALRYVEMASRVYLVECDKKWFSALHRTFEPFKEKVIFCNKRLSGRDNSSEVTIDNLVEGKLDFLKMDIEGSEVYALLGGKQTLENNDAFCAICSYHRQYDDKYISFILESYGYKVSHSQGYVFFLSDDYLMDSMDLRRGVIYARKK